MKLILKRIGEHHTTEQDSAVILETNSKSKNRIKMKNKDKKSEIIYKKNKSED